MVLSKPSDTNGLRSMYNTNPDNPGVSPTELTLPTVLNPMISIITIIPGTSKKARRKGKMRNRRDIPSLSTTARMIRMSTT